MLVDTYAKCGLFSKVWDVVETVPVQDVVFWKRVISEYAQQGHDEEAFRCFEKLCVHSISPNVASFVSIMKACYKIGSSARMSEIHAEVEKLGFLETRDGVGSSLVDMYFKSVNVAKGEHVFHKLSCSSPSVMDHTAGRPCTTWRNRECSAYL
jgi:pentatricopeptide repeat protein